MKRGVPKAGRGRKVAKTHRLRKRVRRTGPRSRSIEPATAIGVTKQPRSPPKLPYGDLGSASATREPQNNRSDRRPPASVTAAARFDAVAVAELVEAGRARVAHPSVLAGFAARTLFEVYDYESDDPELWQCCQLIRQVLKQAHLALIPLGIVSHDTAPRTRAEEIATGCEALRQWLRPTVHVVRATPHVLIDVKFDHHEEVLPALRDLERGLADVIAGLEKVIQRCPCGPDRRAAR